MIKIKSIKKLKNDKYMIEVVNEKLQSSPHIVSENILIKYNLLSEKELTKEEYKKIIKDNEFDLLYLKAISYISYQMRTISEIKKHLQKETKNQTTINNIIKELKKNKYVNDSTYAKQYVTDKIEYDLVGPKYIKEKLILKGIHYDLITQELISYTEELEYDKISTLIQKEIKYKQKKPYQKVYVSLKQKLLQKGFTSRIIESCILNHKDDIMEMIDEDDLLTKEIQKHINKYDLSKYEDKNKLIKKLMMKGYNYEIIKEHLN